MPLPIKILTTTRQQDQAEQLPAFISPILLREDLSVGNYRLALKLLSLTSSGSLRALFFLCGLQAETECDQLPGLNAEVTHLSHPSGLPHGLQRRRGVTLPSTLYDMRYCLLFN
jgi:hypothetical protein